VAKAKDLRYPDVPCLAQSMRIKRSHTPSSIDLSNS
jgi:hypothetical protein